MYNIPKCVTYSLERIMARTVRNEQYANEFPLITQMGTMIASRGPFRASSPSIASVAKHREQYIELETSWEMNRSLNTKTTGS